MHWRGNGKAKREWAAHWHGTAKVTGLHHKSLWLAHRTTTVKCSKGHVRHATASSEQLPLGPMLDALRAPHGALGRDMQASEDLFMDLDEPQSKRSRDTPSSTQLSDFANPNEIVQRAQNVRVPLPRTPEQNAPDPTCASTGKYRKRMGEGGGHLGPLGLSGWEGEWRGPFDGNVLFSRIQLLEFGAPLRAQNSTFRTKGKNESNIEKHQNQKQVFTFFSRFFLFFVVIVFGPRGGTRNI